jgi:hypothetical protein
MGRLNMICVCLVDVKNSWEDQIELKAAECSASSSGWIFGSRVGAVAANDPGRA